MTSNVHVKLESQSYDVHIGTGLLATIGELLRSIDAVNTGGKACLVNDHAIPAPITSTIRSSLEQAGFDVQSIDIESSETNKSIETATRVLHRLAEFRLERRDVVIALGGGVVGDVAGFAAAIYRRGVPVVQCPTTLLSMVDSSVGGKTGVNLRTGTGLKKNLVGAFWQPSMVIADLSTLDSLPERHIRAGLAECLKHALISRSVPRADADLFEWTNRNLIKLRMKDKALLAELVQRNVQIKASVVEKDERETQTDGQGGRMLLNLGHTFGHALETIPHLSPDGRPENAPLQHGEAVALGLVAAAACSQSMGRLKPEEVEQIRVSVERLGMESHVVGLPNDEALLELMHHDKKVQGGQLRLVLPTAIGRASVFVAPGEEHIRAGLTAIRT